MADILQGKRISRATPFDTDTRAEPQGARNRVRYAADTHYLVQQIQYMLRTFKNEQIRPYIERIFSRCADFWHIMQISTHIWWYTFADIFGVGPPWLYHLQKALYLLKRAAELLQQLQLSMEVLWLLASVSVEGGQEFYVEICLLVVCEWHL